MSTSYFNALLLAIIVSCAPTCFAKDQKLSFDASFTYGSLGPKRQNIFVPGEVANITGRLSGLTVDSDGRARYAIQWELLNKELRNVATETHGDLKGTFALGGDSTRLTFPVAISANLVPGTYTLRLTAEDLISHATSLTELELTINTVESITLSDIEWSRDKQGSIDAGSFFNEGEKAIIRYSIQGLEEGEGQWKIGAYLRILDHNKKPVVKRELPFHLKASPPVDGKLTLWAEFYAHRSGRYFLVLEVIDEVSQKSSTHEIPFFVVSPDSDF